MARPETHGPIKSAATGENVWGGTLTFDVSVASPRNFTNLSTKVFRTDAKVLWSAGNQTAARLVTGQVTPNQTTNQQVGVFMTIPTNGTLRVLYPTHPTAGASGRFVFFIYAGGTAGV